MTKLQIYIEVALDVDEMQQAKKSCLEHYNKFWSEVNYNRNDNAFIRVDHWKHLKPVKAMWEMSIKEQLQHYLMLLVTDLNIFLPDVWSQIFTTTKIF